MTNTIGAMTSHPVNVQTQVVIFPKIVSGTLKTQETLDKNSKLFRLIYHSVRSNRGHRSEDIP